MKIFVTVFPYGVVIYKGYEKIEIFDVCLCISETIQDMTIVTMEDEQELVYDL